jgi:transcriptional regulator with XRE-family HTH domain
MFQPWHSFHLWNITGIMDGMKRTYFTDLLAQLIADRGVTRYRVAALAGISQGHMTKLARGDRPPTDEVIGKLAPVLGTTVETLKKAALRDRIDPVERETIAEIAAEEAGPEQIARWVNVHFRNQGTSPQARKEFVRQMLEQIAMTQESWDTFRRTGPTP